MLVSCQARKWRFGHRVILDRIPSQSVRNFVMAMTRAMWLLPQAREHVALNEVRLIANAIMTDPAPSRPTNADMPARNLMNDRVRHYGATLCVRRNADAAANPPVSVQIAAKACREFRLTDFA
jgi:hypothetical protein